MNPPTNVVPLRKGHLITVRWASDEWAKCQATCRCGWEGTWMRGEDPLAGAREQGLQHARGARA